MNAKTAQKLRRRGSKRNVTGFLQNQNGMPMSIHGGNPLSSERISKTRK